MPQHDGSSTYALGACCDEAHRRHPASRRSFLQAGAALAAAGAVTPLLPTTSIAQTADPELTRLTGARRILIKGGVVLTLDRQVGDFPQADILIEDGKIRDLRPSIAVSGDDVAIVDGTNHILIPGFVDTHCHSYQGLLRGADRWQQWHRRGAREQCAGLQQAPARDRFGAPFFGFIAAGTHRIIHRTAVVAHDRPPVRYGGHGRAK